ncbi:hypothetical protein BDN67DRAFT_984479 [Paxillus ammoniavirescens]|nr:hypothetical protein BDN67DRAFT_984479 [Paxillus ammoniavirescens]
MPCSVLEEYREISGQGQVAHKEAIITQVIWQFVTVDHKNDIEATKKLQNSARNWLNNRSWELTDKEEYFQKTNWFMVLTSDNANQIKEETQKLTKVAPGLLGYVQYWRKAASALLKTLSDSERQTYVDLAVGWNTKGVPKDVRMKHLVMLLEQIDNSHSPDQNCACQIPLLDFSWDTNSHHAGDVPHKSWAMAFKAITLVTLHNSAGERHDTPQCCHVKVNIGDWCKMLRRTILKGSQHKPMVPKRPKPVTDLPVAKKPRKDATQEPVIAAWPTRIQKPKKMDPSDYLINKSGHALQNS